MKAFRRKRVIGAGGTTHRRTLDDDEIMRSASLGSPIFAESWNGGSPLNWVEFLGRWECSRMDHRASDREG